jgi:subtilase family serine protease
VGNGLNLSVASESVQAPSNVTGGASFATSQKVCNTGTAYSGGSTLELRLSADTTITSADTLVGATPVPGLAAGECTNVSLNASASVAAGTWYLASRVDPGSSLSELREDDNTSIPVLLGVGSGSDLQVSAVSGPTSVAPHASFSATTTVCNRGTASAAASQVAVRLTLQSYGTQDSFVVGTAPVAALGAGQCQPITVPATAPSLFFDYSPVVFTLSAVADSTGVVPELVETNNATSGARLVIGMRPDFVITAVNGPTTARPYGSPPIVLVTVCNQGTTSGSPTPEIYFSSDSSLTFDDFRSAPVSMPTLNPGQCHTASAPAWSPGEGSWYLGANIMSPQDAELSFDNNALLGNPIVTREWPNLAVTSVKAAQSVLPGNPFTTDVSICNRGFLDSPPTYLELRVSTDSVLTNSDPMVGVTQVGRLMGGQCTTVRTQFTSPPPGSWFVGAMVDPGNGMQESSEEDNAALGGVLAVGNGLNLSVASESVQAPSNVTGGASFTTSMNVCNTGTAYSGGSTLELRLSADTTITSADTLVGATPVPGLAAGACANVSLNASSSVATGTWYLAARVDPGSSLSELREDDNTSIPVLLGVGSGSDLQVSAVSGPASVAPHASFSTTATVCNRGTTSAAASQVAVRLTLQGYGTQDSFVVGTAPVAALGAGQCQPITVPATAPSLFFDYSPVVFTLSALADSASVVTELVESNNAATSGARLVIGMRPDFVITAVSGPAQTSLHGPAPTVLVTVCNQGTTSGSPSPEIYFSSDSSLTFDDFRSAPVSMPTLNPGQCHTASAPALPPGEGTWYLGANIMSPQDAELFFDNNALLGNAIVVSW